MTMDAGQIDYIVREVMRQLMSQSQSQPATTAPSQPVSEAANESTLVIADRVVSTAILSGQLSGVTRVQVMPRAIVTPLVADFLRDQGIRLERQSSSGAQVQHAVACGLVADDVLADRVSATLTGWDVTVRRFRDLAEAIKQTSADKDSARQRIVVLTPDWAQAVCQANRHPRIHAAAVHSEQDVGDACRQVDLNVAVIDASRLAHDRLLAVIRAYCDTVGLSVNRSQPRPAVGSPTRPNGKGQV